MTGVGTWLVLSLFFAHFFGDFTPLSTDRMREAKLVGRPVGPIAAHAAVHALLVGLAVLMATRPALLLLVVAVVGEFATHLGIDWFRGRLGGRYPHLQDPGTQAFWTALGLDQLAHYLVLLGIASLIA
jgi:hypothetical protein